MSIKSDLGPGFQTNTFEKIGWSTILEMLDLEKNYLENDNEHNGWPIWTHRYEANVRNRLITCAALNNASLFNAYMDELNQILIRQYTDRYHWAAIVRDVVRQGELLKQVIDALYPMDKLSFIFPYLLQIVETLEEYARKHDDFDERYMHSLYSELVQCASDASCEKGLSREQERLFWKIEDEYQEKLDAITDTDYTLNWND